MTAIIIYLIVASYSFNFYNLANRANIGGCKVNFTATNSGKTPNYKIDILDFHVKIKGGTWESKTPTTLSIHNVGTTEFTVSLDFGCDSKRQYRIHLAGTGGDYYYYYPSKSSWTKKTSIDLGDLNRFFTK